MSSDLSTGRTPAASSHTKGGLSVHMAPAAAMFGTQVSPEEYRKRKVALLTGQFFHQLATSSRSHPLRRTDCSPLDRDGRERLTRRQSLQVSPDRTDLTSPSSSSKRATRFTACKGPFTISVSSLHSPGEESLVSCLQGTRVSLLPLCPSDADAVADSLLRPTQHPSFLVVQHWPYRAPLQGCPRASVKLLICPLTLISAERLVVPHLTGPKMVLHYGGKFSISA
jgi:hypothetical protein